MGDEDKEKVATLKKQENYNLVKSEESLQRLIELEQQQMLLDDAQEADADKEDPMYDTYKYFDKFKQDLDTNDLLSNEMKLRKLYNLVHKEGYPVEKLSKETKKQF